MAEEAGDFAFDDVAEAIGDKMVRRHPHVFGETAIATAAAQTIAWEELKAGERQAKGAASALDGVGTVCPPSPAPPRSSAAPRASVSIGRGRAGLREDAEEIAELREAMDEGDDRIEDELGDLLFAVVNLARKLDTNPEQALRRACRKFERRFRRVETLLVEGGQAPGAASLDEMEAKWQAAKREER